MSELGGERIDIIEWNDDAAEFIKEALSPATPVSVEINEAEHRATVTVTEDEQSLAIGRGGQNVRLAAKLTGWNIDIVSTGGAEVAESDGTEVVIPDQPETSEAGDPDALAKEAGIMPSESEEIVIDAPAEHNELPAEEELTELPGSDETAADKEEDRDKADDSQ